MKKEIIIIGGGIVGSTAAFYLSRESKDHITLIDSGNGTATRAAAGIICPWLSQRRNMDWYRLTSQGASFYQTLMNDLKKANLSDLPYQQKGTLVFKNKVRLVEKLYHIAKERQKNAEMMGDLSLYPSQEIHDLIPQLEGDQGAVLATGGGRLDGAALLDALQDQFVKNGGTIIKGQASLTKKETVQVNQQELDYDQIILASGAWLPQLLGPLGYQVDISPQKGQLFEVQTDFQTDNWPGCMLHGEIDILPFEKGKLVIGASHENKKGFDLSIDEAIITKMKETATSLIPSLANYSISKVRVGTRAYTSDFLPFYGNLKDNPKIWVASGLGSSGLTSGPFIGWQLTKEMLGQNLNFDPSPYSPEQYIKKIEESSD
ncbi:glycine/D-amino acid oxidases (deaminating) [Streptococcus varani]|uniref:Glycine/D-amino acid oxidases (Deaminating) n=1 Tax=Streptococcus varani TaxID=1608583 RepID=A0A0E3WFG8_9STRE|nr:FAD-dependent oxidoreductase [Streptococcus varani]CQR25490.1 glycine/D-amino acid oxidases (deaminating) [Streptococcus varani]